jgi:hypothetical protein
MIDEIFGEVARKSASWASFRSSMSKAGVDLQA